MEPSHEERRAAYNRFNAFLRGERDHGLKQPRDRRGRFQSNSTDDQSGGLDQGQRGGTPGTQTRRPWYDPIAEGQRELEAARK
jgi:hypothetical protein